MNTIHVVGAAILRNGEVLAAQRAAGMKTPLKWEFPGGKVEPGESHQQALQRELQEEMGITVAAGRYVATGYSTSGDREVVLHVYEAILLEGEPQALEHAAIRWVKPAKMMELDWAQADIPACLELVKRYGGSLFA